jgi:hypothetical protein
LLGAEQQLNTISFVTVSYPLCTQLLATIQSIDRSFLDTRLTADRSQVAVDNSPHPFLPNPVVVLCPFLGQLIIPTELGDDGLLHELCAFAIEIFNLFET